MRYKWFLAVMILLVHATPMRAQVDFLSVGSDSSCFVDQSDKLLLRTFVMRKFNKYTLGHDGIPSNITYRANDNYNIGFGAHYKWLGVNFSFQMPLVNSDDRHYGNTRFFDLQSYLYLDKIAVDLFILSYKGYYLANNDVLLVKPSNGRLIRPDLITGNYGANFQYIFNNEKFSYRAAFVQNQCQMRSAGSVIVGGAAHFTRVKADSAVIPLNTLGDEFFMQQLFNKSGGVAIGVNAGYAYTQVIRRHFFITGSFLAGTGVNYTWMKTDATGVKDATINMQLHGIIRCAAGYNTERFFIGAQYINFISRNNGIVKDAWQQLQSGNIRLTYARRFTLKKKTVKTLEKIEDKMMAPIKKDE